MVVFRQVSVYRDCLIINIVLNSHSSRNKNIPLPAPPADQPKFFLAHEQHQLDTANQLFALESRHFPSNSHRKHRNLSHQPQLSHFPNYSQSIKRSCPFRCLINAASKLIPHQSMHLLLQTPTHLQNIITSIPISPSTYQSSRSAHLAISRLSIHVPYEYNKSEQQIYL